MLTVYRASAGSGKTFRLTLEYLKFLFSADNAYLRILAVTFTNKATEEMKRRVIDELNLLAYSVGESLYTESLCRILNVSEQDVQVRSRHLLQTLLHDFSGFNISTIDRFFQQTMRAFTREIGLQGGYNLEIDSNYVLSQAIDNMLFRLEDTENKELLQWLLQFSGEKVENGQGWDIRRDIGVLSKEIFNENYKVYRQEILSLTADKKLLTGYLTEMYTVRKQFEESLREAAEQGLKEMAEAGLSPEDFKGGTRSPLFALARWASGENTDFPKPSFEVLLDHPDNWKTKKSVRAIEIDLIYPRLNEAIRHILACFEMFPLYLSAVETARYIYTLGILSDIDRYVQQYQQEHNLLLLSDTTELLNKIIDGSDTPFVYEKIGTQIDHYMIDEFQDTSKMQWQNFLPLFRESMDRNRDCLIVGDVKQSIYRWRNSDWKLLSERIALEFDDQKRRDAVLDTNWRSGARIIAFNNVFFTRASRWLQEQFNELCRNGYLNETERGELSSLIIHAYADVCQQVPETLSPEKGHVKLHFVEDQGETDWTVRMLEKLPEILMQLQDNGFLLRDIALLVRSKSEGAQLADFLLQYKADHQQDGRYRFDIISDEALYLSNSPFVKLMIRLLNYLYRPQEELNQILAAYEYYVTLGELGAATALNICLQSRKNDDSLFPDRVEKYLEEIRTLPLFEMCEKLIALFPSFDEKEGVFVQAFQDLVLSFTMRNSADVASFLRWWEEQGANKTVSMPDSQDAIRIITIHKSKGLAFKAVIVPFCNWEIDHSAVHSNILWCKTHQEPFSRLPLVPVRYSSRLERTIYAAEYFMEKIHAYIDNLNLAYVAFTRAREELILFAPYPKKNKLTLASLLRECVDDSNFMGPETGKLSLPGRFDIESGIYESGQSGLTGKSSRTDIQEMNMPVYQSSDLKGRLQLKLYAQGFFGDDGERLYGNLMHDILSRIETECDVVPAVERTVLSGELSEIDSVRVIDHLKKWISQPKTRRWFADGVRVLNEVELIRKGERLLRPDRVVMTADGVEVIDYKFGRTERNVYFRQVRSYVETIRRMGYSNVTGFVWYVELDKVITVN